MLQRSSSCSSRAHGSGEHCVINVNQQQPVQVKQCPPKKIDDMADLHLDTKKKKNISLPSSAGKWVLHAIPVIVLLCLVLLWWFSYHVKLVKEDGLVTAIHQIETTVPLNDTHIDVTILAVATSPNTSVPLNLTSNNETEAHLVSTTDLRTILGDAAFSIMFA
ncbi:hypothetical protein CFP56_022675 [Quercus suber]|uniref:Transmembrane protein n=1 Tax=Quercus suber TaxID=58331 RepID=A0AAW0M0L1_QUESU|nr:uncharacterized protein LOC111998563 [Quercus suber]POE68469.1 hypothetical protein CFP56_20776 [Quercus suber]